MSDRQVFIVSAVRSPTGKYLCALTGFAFEPVRLISQDTKYNVGGSVLNKHSRTTEKGWTAS
jgi:hypothetical protein